MKGIYLSILKIKNGKIIKMLTFTSILQAVLRKLAQCKMLCSGSIKFATFYKDDCKLAGNLLH